MTKKDIKFLLSGGVKNRDPNLSLGGLPSNTDIGVNINNLFSDVSRQDMFEGRTDYRCFYILNDSADEKITDTGLFLKKDESNGAIINVGLSLTNEIQVITVPGNPVGGSFRLSFTQKTSKGVITDETRTILWVPDPDFMAQRISALVNSLGTLIGVTCTGQKSSYSYDFLLTFAGASSGRAQEMLKVIDDQGLNPTISRIKIGGPINKIAPNIGISNNPPNDVDFMLSARRDTIKIGTMLPGDYLPVWVKREVSSDTVPLHPDRFGIKLIGEPISIHKGFHIKD